MTPFSPTTVHSDRVGAPPVVSERGLARVTVCSTFGDPWSAFTWSGTALNLCSAFKSSGRLERALDASVIGNPVTAAIARTAARVRYGNDRQCHRAPLLSSLRARRIREKLRTSESLVLHIGNDHLPLSPLDPSQRHFLYIDATPAQVRANSLQGGWSSPALVRDVDRAYAHMIEQLEHIFPIGRHVRDSLVNDYGVDPSRITPVGTGRGIEFPPLQRADDGRTVLFVAKRQFEEKGGLLLLQAFQRARTRRDDIRLVIAGQDAYPARFGRIPGVIAHGRVDLKQLGELYASATLFAMPALFEPWGLVYLEALSCGVPIVALRRNAMPELSGDGRFGFLSEDADPEALAGVLLDALNDPARLRRMGEEGREHVTRYYTWPQTVARMLAVMDAPTGPGEST